MGRHGVAEDPVPVVEPTRGRWIVVLIALLVLILGLGLWWWSQRAPRDPIDAAPVAATAVVLSSSGCAAEGITQETVVDLGLGSNLRSTLSGCGFAVGQRIDVEYRSGDQARVRLAGTSTSGSGGAPRWLPFLILLVGLLVLGVTATLLFFGAGRRRTVRVQRAARISVAELRRALESTGPPAAGESLSRALVSEPADPASPHEPESARPAG